MSWEDATALSRRPIAVVEDHLFHVGELLQAMADAAPDLLPHTTVLCLERPGPDTTAAVARWLAAFPGLCVAAAGAGRALDPHVFTVPHVFCRTLAGLLRPGGLLLQDIQLSTLAFVPADRWWESIYLAATVRGLYPSRPPECRFLSNKRGYEATFGRDLAEAGFDPRDVIEKRDLAQVVVPTLRAFLERRFPWRLEAAGDRGLPAVAVGPGEDDRREAEAELDLIAWLEPQGAETALAALEVGGRALAGDRRVRLRAGSPEGETWRRLIADRLEGGEGAPVAEIGERVAPPGALRAEVTNAAARHLHLLRSRLRDPGAIVTARHAYRLREELRVAMAKTPSPPTPLPSPFRPPPGEGRWK